MKHPKIIFRVHAIQRMFERGITVMNVRRVLESGETVEDYSSEMPEPSRLILGFQGRRPLHLVTAENPASHELTVITVYVPNSDKWNKDFKSRKS